MKKVVDLKDFRKVSANIDKEFEDLAGSMESLVKICREQGEILTESHRVGIEKQNTAEVLFEASQSANMRALKCANTTLTAANLMRDKVEKLCEDFNKARVRLATHELVENGNNVNAISEIMARDPGVRKEVLDRLKEVNQWCGESVTSTRRRELVEQANAAWLREQREFQGDCSEAEDALVNRLINKDDGQAKRRRVINRIRGESDAGSEETFMAPRASSVAIRDDSPNNGSSARKPFNHPPSDTESRSSSFSGGTAAWLRR